jgi:hypothetical protein
MKAVFAAMAIAWGALIAGCTTYKLWSEFDADERAGTVQLSYEFRKFENPQVDERAAIETARERCKGWRYQNAHRTGEERVCISGTETNCSKWRLIRSYQCDAPGTRQ